MKGMFRKWRLPSLPDPERDVLKQLGRAGLPLDRQAYQSRYNLPNFRPGVHGKK